MADNIEALQKGLYNKGNDPNVRLFKMPDSDDSLNITDEQIQEFYNEMLKMLSTQGQAQKNQAMDYMAYKRLPESTISAASKGIDYNALLAGQQGLSDLKQWQIGTNIESQKFLKQLAMQKELAEMAQGDIWSNLLGSAIGGVGMGAGAYLGKSLFSKK